MVNRSFNIDAEAVPTDPCKNPDCEYQNCCQLRRGSANQANQIVAKSTALAPALDEHAEIPGSESLKFFLRCEPVGWIGVLRITGGLKTSIWQRLFEIEKQLQTLSGLMMHYDSYGGDYIAGEALECLVLLASKTMPVVSYIREAQSTCLLPSVAADLVCGGPDAICGGYGSILPCCDGHQPTLLVNSQSPEKLKGGATSWPPRVFADEARQRRLREQLDHSYEHELRIAAGYCCRSADKLRPYLNGRTMGADVSIKAGLLDRICTEDQAYGSLLRMAEKHNISTNY